ncbi:MAG: hypothetical protein AAF944_25260 [Bacteroidota bacterium]
MKYFFALLATLLYLSALGQVTIKGKINNYDRETIIYYHPTIEGIYTPYWKEIQPKANGSFTIKFENEGYGTTTLSFQRLIYRLFHDDNSEIYLEIDQNKILEGREKQNKSIGRYERGHAIKQRATIEISGDYASVNQFYNQQLRTNYSTTRSVSGSSLSKLIYRADTPEQVNTILDSLIQQEYQQIDTLLLTVDVEDSQADRKSKEIKDFLRNEVEAFYGAIFLSGMFLKRREHVTELHRDSTALVDIYNREWEQMIEAFADRAIHEIKPDTRSPDYIDLMESLSYILDTRLVHKKGKE